MLADRLEKITFNSLPGTFTPDMWGHQDDQQANQVMVSLSKRDWVSNGPESNIFGLGQILEAARRTYTRAGKIRVQPMDGRVGNGLAAVSYSPNEVTTTVGNGVAITVNETTDYPFATRSGRSLIRRGRFLFLFRFESRHGFSNRR